MFRLRLVLGAILFFLVYRLTLIPIKAAPVMLASWAADAAVFAALFVVAEMLAFLNRRLSAWLFHPVYLSYFITTFLFCFFFREAVWRRYSVLDMGPSGIAYFFMHVMPIPGTLFLIGSVAGLYAISRYVRPIRMHSLAAPIILLVTVGMARNLTGDPLDAPVVYIRNDIKEAIDSPSVSPVAPPASSPLNTWKNGSSFHPRYKKIIVFVMESITLKTLKQDASVLSEKSILRHAQNHSHHYDNLFAANMDSRTGMLAMLTARFVPHEAYDDADVAQYEFLAKKRSLVDLMKESGYRTAFAASESEHEEVVYDLPWDDHLVLTEEDRAEASKKKFVCMVPYEFEHSCEDNFILDRLVDWVASNDRAFLYQEFLYGHSDEYLDEMHINPVKYYSDYIDAFADRLRSKGLLKDTLIVITSDHGIRLKGYEPWLSTYRIPLMFVHPERDDRGEGRVYSQIDFKDIFVAEAERGPTYAVQRDFAPIIGMTSSSLVGAVTKDLDLILIKDRLWLPYVLRHENNPDQDQPAGPPVSSLTPGELLGRVRSYRKCFPNECN